MEEAAAEAEAVVEVAEVQEVVVEEAEEEVAHLVDNLLPHQQPWHQLHLQIIDKGDW